MGLVAALYERRTSVIERRSQTAATAEAVTIHQSLITRAHARPCPALNCQLSTLATYSITSSSCSPTMLPSEPVTLFAVDDEISERIC
jgi:hypothetical protein